MGSLQEHRQELEATVDSRDQEIKNLRLKVTSGVQEIGKQEADILQLRQESAALTKSLDELSGKYTELQASFSGMIALTANALLRSAV